MIIRKFSIIILFTISFGNQVMADTGAGCGVGTMIFAGKSGPVFHVMAATTNGTYGNQTFGMSTGTLGCDVNQPIINTPAFAFLDGNLDKIARDTAQGEGEAIDTLASLIGIKADDKLRFFAAVQENFVVLFPDEKATSQSVSVRLNAILSRTEGLQQYRV